MKAGMGTLGSYNWRMVPFPKADYSYWVDIMPHTMGDSDRPSALQAHPSRNFRLVPLLMSVCLSPCRACSHFVGMRWWVCDCMHM